MIRTIKYINKWKNSIGFGNYVITVIKTSIDDDKVAQVTVTPAFLKLELELHPQFFKLSKEDVIKKKQLIIFIRIREFKEDLLQYVKNVIVRKIKKYIKLII